MDNKSSIRLERRARQRGLIPDPSEGSGGLGRGGSVQADDRAPPTEPPEEAVRNEGGPQSQPPQEVDRPDGRPGGISLSSGSSRGGSRGGSWGQSLMRGPPQRPSPPGGSDSPSGSQQSTPSSADYGPSSSSGAAGGEKSSERTMEVASL